MAAVVEMWMSELGKLGQKVRKRPLAVSSKAKVNQGEDRKEEEEEVVKKEMQKDSSSSSSSSSSSTGLSEETVFLLMDRFAPL
ncbi:hypothetical protein TIFTF001_006877 [Ficus carica]|uniref:Uncharacterized protein n=1 Tax=Ficus carica TaxID=3494 RepID=A0AA87ZNS6_FICCA|nr:hypothetical protein TIFTF001_006877 [Ficus carica]